jgi:hypothetical protein
MLNLKDVDDEVALGLITIFFREDGFLAGDQH